MLRRAWRSVSTWRFVRPFTEWRIWIQWRMAGRPIPPPAPVKHRLLKQYLRSHGLRTFIETGTFAGETVAALAALVDRVVSIELDPALAASARARFAAARHVTILQGNSGELLARVVEPLTEPALFWLDGHYSGSITARGDLDSPIASEIDAILRHPVAGHVVLIDDARYFTGRDGYPTADALRARILASMPGSRVDIRDDIIHWVTAEDADARGSVRYSR